MIKILLTIFALLQLSCTTLVSKTDSSIKNDILTHSEAQLRSIMLKDVEYDLDITLNKENEFTGVTKIRFFVLNDEHSLRVDFKDGKIHQLFVNGKNIEIDYNEAFLRVPAKYLLREKTNEIVVTYSHPYAQDGRGLHRAVDKEDGRIYLFTQFEPFDANRLFPCFDQPDLKAHYNLSVTAPKTWEVISSERETKVEDFSETQNKWYFPKSKKFSTYIFSLHAGEYTYWKDSYKGIPLRLYARKSLAKYVDTKEWFSATKEGLKFFPKYFNTAFPYNKYDQLIVPEFSSGAMENVGAVTFNEIFVNRGKKTDRQKRSLKETVLHEMAHMWFGNLVTMKWWNDLWLNESFATFTASVAMTKNPQTQMKSMLDFNGTKEWAYWEDRLVTTHPILSEVENTGQAFSNFDGITYGKGASSLRQLVFYIGEENFKKGLAIYFNKFAEQNTTLADFFNSIGEAANQSLTDWQKRWLETTGVNSLSAQFTCDSKNKIQSFSLKQGSPVEPKTLRPHKTVIALLKKNKKNVKIYKTQEFRFESEEANVEPLIGHACPDMVFPNYMDQAYVNVQIDRQTVQFLENNINLVQDPLLHKMLWMDLWRMVRDGIYDVKAYAQLILKFAPMIKDPDIFNSALKFDEVIFYYPQKTKEEKITLDTLVQKSEKILWSIMTKKTNSTDLKKQALNKLLATTRSVWASNKLDELLTNPKIEKTLGFPIDQDLRWQIIRSLAQNNYKKTIQFINSEKKSDPSMKGHSESLAAMASLPQWTLKKPWIEEFKNIDSKYSTSILRNVAYSLFPEQQLSFRKEYSKDFFNDLNFILKNRDLSYSSTFTNLSPFFCENDEKDLITPYLDKNPEIHPVVSKRLKIQRQESQRCLKIRNFSREVSLRENKRL